MFKRMPVNAIAMLYLSHVPITRIISYRTSRLCDIAIPLCVCTFDIVSEGKNASEPKATPVIVSSHARFSSRVRTSGFSVKKLLPKRRLPIRHHDLLKYKRR